VHQHLQRTVINQYSLMYEWKGAIPGAPPYAVYAHMDVVPAPEAEKWRQPPFSGKIVEGYVRLDLT
jgi:carboxypeptidase PM20D1